MGNTTTQQFNQMGTGQIIHRLPGRMRVRIVRLRYDIAYGNDLKQAVNALKGVTEVRINPKASSIIITYQDSELPEQTILNCLRVYVRIEEVVVVGEQIEQTVTHESDSPPLPLASDLTKEAEELTAKIAGASIGETVGEILGEMVGEVLMGPPGMVVGAELGATIGGEIGESIGHTVEELIYSESPATRISHP